MENGVEKTKDDSFYNLSSIQKIEGSPCDELDALLKKEMNEPGEIRECTLVKLNSIKDPNDPYYEGRYTNGSH